MCMCMCTVYVYGVCEQTSIITSVPRRGYRALLYRLCGAQQLHDDLLPQRDLVFCAAACKFHTLSLSVAY